MPTIRKGFSYDEVIDADIKKWFDSLPTRKHSQYIRLAIKEYINRELQEDLLEKIEKAVSSNNETNNEKEYKEVKDDEYEDAKNFMNNIF